MGDRLEGLREAIKEAVAETSEELLDKFIMGEEFTPEEIILGVSQGVKDGTICPVFCGDAHNTFAIDQLLNSLTWLAPSAADKSGEIGVDLDGEPVDVSVNDGGAAAAIVFKTVADPFIGRLSYVKVVSGKVSSDAPLINMRTGAQERITKVLSVSGKKQSDVPYIGAGDIGAIPKLASTKTGDTLCSPLRKVVLDGIDYPSSSYTMAVYPAKKGDEDKVAQGIAKLADEDPTIKLVSNHETHEMLLSGLGEQHLDVQDLKQNIMLTQSSKSQRLHTEKLSAKRFPHRADIKSSRAATVSSVMCGLNLSRVIRTVLYLPKELSAVQFRRISSLLLKRDFRTQSRRAFLQAIRW